VGQDLMSENSLLSKIHVSSENHEVQVAIFLRVKQFHPIFRCHRKFTVEVIFVLQESTVRLLDKILVFMSAQHEVIRAEIRIELQRFRNAWIFVFPKPLNDSSAAQT